MKEYSHETALSKMGSRTAYNDDIGKNYVIVLAHKEAVELVKYVLRLEERVLYTDGNLEAVE